MNSIDRIGSLYHLSLLNISQQCLCLGSGNVLGSIAPSVTPPTASPSLDPAQAEKAAQDKAGLDGGKPVANIQAEQKIII